MLFAVACEDDSPSLEEAQAALCGDLESLGATLDALSAIGSEATVGDLQDARDDVNEAVEEVQSSAEDVEDASTDELESAYDELDSAINDIPEDATIEDAVTGIETAAANVQTAWQAVVTEAECEVEEPTPAETAEEGTPADEAAEIAEVEETFTQTFESDATNADYFFAHVTDNLITTVLFAPSRAECEANPEECIGEPGTVESIEGTTIEGDTASLTATVDFGVFDVGMVQADDVWMVDSFQAVSDEVAEGTPLVELTLGEFVFGFDDTTIPADGNFAFDVTNGGGQVHEVVVVPVAADVPLEQALEDVQEEDTVGFKLFIQPGQEVDMAFEQPFAPGRYALVCFFPDTSSPEMTSHAELGMVNEFTIQ